jgi:hypothetical protein
MVSNAVRVPVSFGPANSLPRGLTPRPPLNPTISYAQTSFWHVIDSVLYCDASTAAGSIDDLFVGLKHDSAR